VHYARADRQHGRDLSDQADGPASVPLSWHPSPDEAEASAGFM
jgi:hypothetical protein